MPHSTVLLAGGSASRMGRDKSALIFAGTPLWRHQLVTMRATEPAQLLISGANDGRYADAGIPVIPDHTPGLGPLGGIATALRHCPGDPLLVLAVDSARTCDVRDGKHGEGRRGFQQMGRGLCQGRHHVCPPQSRRRV